MMAIAALLARRSMTAVPFRCAKNHGETNNNTASTRLYRSRMDSERHLRICSLPLRRLQRDDPTGKFVRSRPGSSDHEVSALDFWWRSRPWAENEIACGPPVQNGAALKPNGCTTS